MKQKPSNPGQQLQKLGDAASQRWGRENPMQKGVWDKITNAVRAAWAEEKKAKAAKEPDAPANQTQPKKQRGLDR